VIFYLHGFASSPKSTKAEYFAERFARHGVPLRCPDFNQPDFSTLTMTRMLTQLEAAIAEFKRQWATKAPAGKPAAKAAAAR